MVLNLSESGYSVTHNSKTKPADFLEETKASDMETIFIGETISLIYAPVYLKSSSLYDALLKRSISPLDESDSNLLSLHPRATNWQIRFIPTLCPVCGLDMECERHAMAAICRNCTSFRHCPQTAFQNLSFLWHATMNSFIPKCIWLSTRMPLNSEVSYKK